MLKNVITKLGLAPKILINIGHRFHKKNVNFLSTTTFGNSRMIKAEIDDVTNVVNIESLNNIKLNLITPETTLYYATERDLPTHWDSLPWWGIIWPGGWGLTKFLQANNSMFENKNILDFACGCGISSIAVAQLGAKKVVANDIDLYALHATALNAEINHVDTVSITGSNSAINDDAGNLIHLNGDNLIGKRNLLLFDDFTKPPDIIICGDIFYDDTMAEAILLWFKELKFHYKADIDIYFGDPDRWVLQTMERGKRKSLFTKVDTIVFEEYYSKEHNGITESYVYKVN
jgi:predicted nicotinamide N-methyase